MLLGVYSDSVLVVTSFPQEISLQAMLTVMSPVDFPFKKLIIRAYHDEHEIYVDHVSPKSLAAFPDLPSVQGYDADVINVFRVIGVLQLGPVNVTKPGTIRVRIETESEIIPAGAIDLLDVKS